MSAVLSSWGVLIAVWPKWNSYFSLLLFRPGPPWIKSAMMRTSIKYWAMIHTYCLLHCLLTIVMQWHHVIVMASQITGKFSLFVQDQIKPSITGPLRGIHRSPVDSPWWRHQTETFSSLLALCAGNSLVTDEFPSQRPVTRSFDVVFDLRRKWLCKQSRSRWFERPSRSLWRHHNASQ